MALSRHDLGEPFSTSGAAEAAAPAALRVTAGTPGATDAFLAAVGTIR
jgi:hypothetical protein